MFSEGDTPDRFDTVLRDAAVIVEDRLRTSVGASTEVIGLRLAQHCFGGDSPRLHVSSVKAEQLGALHLFEGYFGLIRNPPGHRLMGELSKERVMQELGVADLLLSIIESAERSA
jgi:hypothetical protein